MRKYGVKSSVQHQGFTLIEVLIALFIFALIGTLAALTLQRVLQFREQLQKKNRALLELQTSLALLQQDFSQALDRPALDPDAHSTPAFSGDVHKALWTNSGNLNPGYVFQRSLLQTVQYGIKDHALVRTTWPVLDQSPYTKPREQVLLSRLQQLDFAYINDQGETSHHWPPLVMGLFRQGLRDPTSVLPRGVILTMELEDLGTIRRVFIIHAHAFYP